MQTVQYNAFFPFSTSVLVCVRGKFLHEVPFSQHAKITYWCCTVLILTVFCITSCITIIFALRTIDFFHPPPFCNSAARVMGVISDGQHTDINISRVKSPRATLSVFPAALSGIWQLVPTYAIRLVRKIQKPVAKQSSR